MSRTLVQGGCVLTLGAKTPNFSEADVLIEDGRITEVGPGLRARGAEHIDATDTIVMPGFVDAHRHAWRSIFRNRPVFDWSDLDGAARCTPDDAYTGTLLGLLGALVSGTTTVVDWSDIQADTSFTEAVLQAHADAGLRTVFIPAAAPWSRGAVDPSLPADGRAPGPLTTVAFGAPDPTVDSLDSTMRAWSEARDRGLRIHTHVRSPESRGAAAALAEQNLLGDDVTFVHCAGLSTDDLDAVQSSRASVTLTPSSEMATGLGVPPVQQLLDRGIRPGLGGDDDRVAPVDMLAQMRATISLQHATYFDLKLAGKAGLPNLLTTREVIKYATIDSARAAGLAQVTGSIEAGKAADLIVLRTDRPNIFPVNDPIGAVVWGMDTSNLDWAFVGGEPLVQHGAAVADTDRVRSLARAAQERLQLEVARSGGGNEESTR